MTIAKDTKQASETPVKEEEKSQDKNMVPSLGALDEDDEFEEFETEDWSEKDSMIPGGQSCASETFGASTALDMSGSTRLGGDHLWEDNWDDDDVEDDFNVALRAELEKVNAPEAMTN